MKKSRVLFLGIALAVGIIVASTSQALTKSGSCGPRAKWKLDSKGTLTITGSGEVKGNNFTKRIEEKTKSIVLKKGITSIGDAAFYYFRSAKKVSLPSSLREIKDDAFSYGKFEDIAIPNGVSKIGARVFAFNSKLKKVTLPNTVKSIGEDSFYACVKLQQITLSNKLTVIPSGLLRNCSLIKEIKIPQSIRVIGDNAFSGCIELSKMNIPVGVQQIGYYPFWKTAIKRIELPKGLMKLGTYEFGINSSIRSIKNNSNIAINLTWCSQSGNLQWRVNGQQATTLQPGETAFATAKKYPITYKYYGGKLTGAICRQYEVGVKQSIQAKAKKKGYLFFGWTDCYVDDDAGVQGDFFDHISVNDYGKINIKACFAKVKTKKLSRTKLQVDAKWYKWGGAKFQLRYADNKAMKRAKTTKHFTGKKVLKGLKRKKTYYIQIRPVGRHFFDGADAVEYRVDTKHVVTVKVKM